MLKLLIEALSGNRDSAVQSKSAWRQRRNQLRLSSLSFESLEPRQLLATIVAANGGGNWQAGDQIVIASSSCDYADEEVRTSVNSLTELRQAGQRLAQQSPQREIDVADGQLLDQGQIEIASSQAIGSIGAYKVLVFQETAGFDHRGPGSIQAAQATIESLGQSNGFTVDVANNSTGVFTAANLAQYAAVIFNSTSGNVLNGTEQAVFEDYIQAGGGYVGLHAATNTESNWAWHGDLVGASFQNHPSQQLATVQLDPEAGVRAGGPIMVHPAAEGLPQQWQFIDEWYNFENNPRANVNVLLTLDESTYNENDGTSAADDHPIAWWHDFDGGRSFYSGFGHRPQTYSDPLYHQHLLGGIEYAAGVSRVAPQDATVLYDGTGTSQLEHTNGSPVAWSVDNEGNLVIVPSTGDVQTQQGYTDYRLHLEYKTPATPPGTAEQSRGNSGVFLAGSYELQILDSFGNTSYGSNDAGSIYNVKAGDSNAALPAETWNEYDIDFIAALFDAGGSKIANARITAYLNGVLIHDNVEVTGPTQGGAAEQPGPRPIVLQDHDPLGTVRFRNIWVQGPAFGSVQSPFGGTARIVTDGSRIEAEDFDEGGEGVAYHDDDDVHDGDSFRNNEAVDLANINDQVAGRAVITGTDDNEWLEYTADVTGGIYDVDFRIGVFSAAGKSIELFVSDNAGSGSFTSLGSAALVATGNSNTFGTITIPDVNLNSWTGPDRVFRVEFTGGGYKFNWFEFNAVAATATVANRGVAYGDATAAYGEDAIDTSKSAYLHLPGTNSSGANYTNYTKGLNRVVVDLANSQPATLTTADFEFRVGNTNDPAGWTLLDGSSAIPLPTIINGTRNGTTGVQRFALAWEGDQTIKNQWLQVTVKAGGNTGLASDDVFFFGNQIADVFGLTSAGNGVAVNAIDTIQIRAHQSSAPNSVGMNNVYDIDRNGAVNAIDTILARANQASGGGLLMLSAPEPPSAAVSFSAFASMVDTAAVESADAAPAPLVELNDSENPLTADPFTRIAAVGNSTVPTASVEDPASQRLIRQRQQRRVSVAELDQLHAETDLRHDLNASFQDARDSRNVKSHHETQEIDTIFAEPLNLIPELTFRIQ